MTTQSIGNNIFYIDQLSNKDEQIFHIQQFSMYEIGLLQLLFLDKFYIDVQQGKELVFKQTDIVDPYTLKTNFRRIGYLTKEGYPNLSQQKKYDIFVEIIETANEDDVKLLEMIYYKKSKFSHITLELLNEALPDYFPLNPVKQLTKEENVSNVIKETPKKRRGRPSTKNKKENTECITIQQNSMPILEPISQT